MLEKFKNQHELILAIICWLCLGIGWAFRFTGFSLVSIAFFVLAYLTGGFLKVKGSITALITHKKFSVDFLMMVAAIGAAVIGYWEDGAMLIAIFAMSGALETYTFNKSHKEISALMDLQPEVALVLKKDQEVVVAVCDLQVGDVILIKPGDRVPADGQITVGSTNLDEATITGESIPIEKRIGDDVFAGTVNLRGSIEVAITKPSDETLFQKIIQMVQNAQSEKSPSQQFIEKHEGVYVKSVLVVASLMFVLPPYLLSWTWDMTFYRALVMLVVASPCALVASVTPATLSAISNGARNGILFKGGLQLERMGTLTAVAFDKTGTITAGKPVVTDFVVCDEVEKKDLLGIVAGIESHSTHPLADAIIKYASDVHQVPKVSPKTIENVVGFGVIGIVHGKEYKIGKTEMFGEEAIKFSDGIGLKWQNEGKTVVYIGDEEGVLGAIALKDTVRQEADVAIKGLHDLGIATIMITGDNEETARIIASEVGMTNYIASCLPDEKVTAVKKLQEKYNVIAMIGDGINDAPALATANIGIAMGEGSDVALETADVVLMKNNLTRLPQAVGLSKRMNRIIRQNIVFAIAVIGVLILSNFFIRLPIPIAVVAHEGNTILVILNGLRLLHNRRCMA